ncbi:class E sortase [Actinomadura rayongensis]|uniref:Sortase n=1 Tax=Actinomadura rayongensis TaxID=1429076 RepID=A0A6I4WFG1_9ACTN|nr:class E sortase [Actinomadura rayongensis]MXQ65302.1 sortase [Actinomadura rayongensis]
MFRSRFLRSFPLRAARSGFAAVGLTGAVGAASLAAPMQVAESARPPAPVRGEEIAFLSLPRLHKKAVVREGVSPRILESGVGHYPSTQLPGQTGNAVLFGHRTVGAKPFADLDRLRRGDVIDVRSGAHRYRYRVRSLRVITPDRTDVLNPTPLRGGDRRTGSYLTLVTCTPRYSNARRLVAIATLDGR